MALVSFMGGIRYFYSLVLCSLLFAAIRKNDRTALFYKISLGASIVFFIQQLFSVGVIIWMTCA